MLNPQDKNEIQKMIDLATKGTYNKRVGDTPSDALQLVPQKYITRIFTTPERPASVLSSVASQQFFNTTTGYQWYWHPISSVWVSGAGSIVGFN